MTKLEISESMKNKFFDYSLQKYDLHYLGLHLFTLRCEEIDDLWLVVQNAHLGTGGCDFKKRQPDDHYILTAKLMNIDPGLFWWIDLDFKSKEPSFIYQALEIGKQYHLMFDILTHDAHVLDQFKCPMVLVEKTGFEGLSIDTKYFSVMFKSKNEDS